MAILALYWGILIGCYVMASKLRERSDAFRFIGPATMFVIYLLVFMMGLRMGINEQVINHLATIGAEAAVMTAAIIAGSIIAITVTRKAFKIDRYGSALAEQSADEDGGVTKVEREERTRPTEEKEAVEKISYSSTIAILSLVAIGMLAGHFIIADVFLDIFSFDKTIGNLLVVGICILLGLVGFDLGLSGNIAAHMKSVGIKVIAFPIAAVLGSLLFGSVCGIFFGFSLREGIAISAGFGWYTYAPAVIAGAGAQYTVAGAVSFMHNVLREVAGIVLIPVLARKLGYIECAAIPGVAAMDVCIPIVEKSCRPDTVVYSFLIGLLMCITTSLLVPLVMGL